MYDPRFIDLTGHRYNRWTVLRHISHDDWFCRCDCGTEKSVKSYNLRYTTSGGSKSCGCLRNEMMSARRFKHGLTDSPEHLAWQRIRQRCNNPNRDGYSFYGGRGIKVCERWESDFMAFLSDVGPMPSSTCSIDRIDPDGDYEPRNVRWVDKIVQANNTRSNHRVTFQSETRTIAEWSRLVGIRQGTLAKRIREGWPVDAAMTIPVGSAATTGRGRRSQLQGASPNPYRRRPQPRSAR